MSKRLGDKLVAGSGMSALGLLIMPTFSCLAYAYVNVYNRFDDSKWAKCNMTVAIKPQQKKTAILTICLEKSAKRSKSLPQVPSP